MLTYTGKIIDLKPSEPYFPEFPEMLFGRNLNGSMYFDATQYLESKKNSSTVDQFLKAYEAPIDGIVNTLEMNPEEVCQTNKEGHILIESSLLYLFISFIEPRFLLYIIDRMDDLFATGVTVSDNYLVRKTLARIPMEVFKQLKENEARQE